MSTPNPAEVLADVVAAAIRDHDRDAWDGTQIENLRTALFEYRDRTPAPAPAGCAHTWVTALNGDDQPALDTAGRTWVHCGICGQRKATEAPYDSPLHRTYETGHDLPPVWS